MQTNFSPAQLEDARIREADRILKRCVHCGLCTAVCSTYVLLGDERDSPRGRIYLIKDMFERKTAPTAEVTTHVDRCLSCLSCMTTCPSGVDYMHLADLARGHIHEHGRRRLKSRFVRWLLSRVVPYPKRFRMALRLAPLGRPFAPLLSRLGLGEVASMIKLAPSEALAGGRFSGAGTAVTKAERRARVIMLSGCVQKVLRPDINDATIRLLARRGVDVTVSYGAGCCGALVHHLGRESESLDQVRRNVDAWWKEIERGHVDAIIITASGCGTMIKDYGYLLRDDPAYSARAKKISDLALDVTEFLSRYDLGAPVRWSSLKVAYHSACSLQHGQRVVEEPRALLKKAGFSVVDVPEGHICCGSAGVYNILEPELADQLKARKVKNIKSVKPDLVAAGNIGCINQLDGAGDLKVAHTVELLDWAYGGPVPRGLEHLEQFVTNVPEPKLEAEDFITS